MSGNTGPFKEHIDAVLKMMDLLDAGQISAEELRERSRADPELRGTAAWIELAIVLHKSPQEGPMPDPVRCPRYRKGTGRKPASWSDCLWRPPA